MSKLGFAPYVNPVFSKHFLCGYFSGYFQLCLMQNQRILGYMP